jgi:hypothetical protein
MFPDEYPTWVSLKRRYPHFRPVKVTVSAQP